MLLQPTRHGMYACMQVCMHGDMLLDIVLFESTAPKESRCRDNVTGKAVSDHVQRHRTHSFV